MNHWFANARAPGGRKRRAPQAVSVRPGVEQLEDRRVPAATGFLQTNLVSDLAGMAAVKDANLINPWGIAFSPTSAFWISDNNAGVSTLYNGAGQAIPLVVTIPTPTGGTAPSAPTGVVFNGTGDFVVSAGGKSGPAVFIFATEDGTIAGWNPGVDPTGRFDGPNHASTHAVLAVDNANATTGPVYKGLALGGNAQGNFLFATNFRAGTIDVFDTHFAKVNPAGSFTDPNLPAGFAPFGIQNIGGRLYVTYAKQNDVKHDDVAGAGNGFIDVFDTGGHLLRRLASQGSLNSPWGLAVAPADFGEASNDLLVGNFGDGRINVLDPATGAPLGQLMTAGGTPVTIDGLWGLAFGNGAGAGKPHTLFFTAGIQGESHGLFGTLDSAAATPNQHLVAQLYRDLLHREADPGGLASGSGVLDQGGSASQVALAIEGSTEFRTLEVQAAYRLLLHRAADPDGLNNSLQFLAAGGTVEQLEAILAGSAEYMTGRGGGTADGFAAALYQDLLGRPVDAGARLAIDQALAGGATGSQVAAAVLSSTEFQQDLVKGFYQRFLHRAADPNGLNGGVSALAGGLSDEMLIAAITGSMEYAGNV